MSLMMTEIEVRLPGKERRASSSFSRKKPMAEVTCVLENGKSREIVVPARVGRVLIAEGLPLPLEEQEAFDAIHALEGRICFTMLTEMLSRRDHATAEARDKLLNYGFRPEEIEPALTRATDLRFLNDTRFCTQFIEARKLRGWGRRKIELELKRRGVDVDAIPGYPDSFFDEDDDIERARALLARKSIPDVRPFDKLVRHLMSKGFTYGISAQAARERIDSAGKHESGT